MRSLLPIIALSLPLVARAVPDECDAFGTLAVDQDASQGDTLVIGLGRNHHVGRALATLDFNGDGYSDLAVGAPGDDLNGTRAGAVYLFLGPIADAGQIDRDDADMIIAGPAGGRNVGWSVANAGDTDQDGRDDLLVGSAPTSSSVTTTAWLLLGQESTPPIINIGTTHTASFQATLGGQEFGTVVAGVGDINGDGFADVAVGAPLNSVGGTKAGAAFVWYGPLVGPKLAGTADLIYIGESPVGFAGTAIARAGDVDGDGFGDFLIGAPQEESAGSNAGTTYLLFGGAGTGTIGLADAGVKLRGTLNSRTGSALSAAGDIDQDGLADFWVGAKQHSGSKKGAAYLIHGASVISGADIPIEVAYASRLRGLDANDLFGAAIAGNVDFDADGNPDVLIGAERADNPPVLSTGAAWALMGPFPTEATVNEVGRIAGNIEGAFTGSAIAVGPDTNGDGYADALIGSYGATVLGKRDAGTASLFLGGADLADLTTYYRDADGDTWGSTSVTELTCEPSAGFIARSGDCNDASALFHPYAIESDCGDGNDYNCDGSVGPNDLDGDGINACDGDCDDTDDLVGPHVFEQCHDQIDNNCDTLIDDPSAIDAVDWFPDADHDTFGDRDLAIHACEEPPFFLEPPVLIGGDCDDFNDTVNPAALEICDEIDNDCDDRIDEHEAVGVVRVYEDRDGDGYGNPDAVRRACAPNDYEVLVAGDCNDAVAEINPGAPEVCDFEDNNCDGEDYLGGPLDVTDNDLEINSGSPQARLGEALGAASPRFWGQQGGADLIIGAPHDQTAFTDGGAVYILPPASFEWTYGDINEPFYDGTYAWNMRVRASHQRDHVGSAVDAGDINGDGNPDLIIGADNAQINQNGEGAVWLFFLGGSLPETLPIDATTDDADAVIDGANGGDGLGTDLEVIDLDGDGIDDLLVGAPDNDNGANHGGILYIAYGGSDIESGGGIASQADAAIIGTQPYEQIGGEFCTGDFNGDGSPDIAWGSPQFDVLDNGRVGVSYGNGTRRTGPLTGDEYFTSFRENWRIGLSVAAGDINGDGFDDLAVGSGHNEAWILFGSPDGLITSDGGPDAEIQDESDLNFEGHAIGQGIGLEMHLGDMNADGRDDIHFGAPEDDTIATDAGAVYMLYGAGEFPITIESNDLESYARVDLPPHPIIPVDTAMGDTSGDSGSDACPREDEQLGLCDDGICDYWEFDLGICCSFGGPESDTDCGFGCKNDTIGQDYGGCFLLNEAGCACDDEDCEPLEEAFGRCTDGRGGPGGDSADSGKTGGETGAGGPERCEYDTIGMIFGSCTLLSTATCSCDDLVCTEQEAALGQCSDPWDAFPTFSASSLGKFEGTVIYGAEQNEGLGTTLLTADFNGDGYDDLAIGAPDADVNTGRVYVLYGGPFGTDVDPPDDLGGYSHTFTVDGQSDDWNANNTFTTDGGATTAISWDDTHLYIGANSPDVAFAGSTAYFVVYLSDTQDDGSGNYNGFAIGSQQPFLPFEADAVLSWRADDFDTRIQSPNGGGGWAPDGAGEAHARNGEVIEFAIPLDAYFADPSHIRVVAYWVSNSFFEQSYNQIPTGAFSYGEYDPNPLDWYEFSRSSFVGPAYYGWEPDGGGMPELDDTKSAWWWDRDLDGHGDIDDAGNRDCLMHIPTVFEDDGTAHLVATLEEPLVDDCQDDDPDIYGGAFDPPFDGIDQDCSTIEEPTDTGETGGNHSAGGPHSGDSADSATPSPLRPD